MAEVLREIVARQCANFGLALPELAFEPGRAIVGPSTITVYTVGTSHPIALDAGGVRTYVSVDGGMSDNIRTALRRRVHGDASFSRIHRTAGAVQGRG